MVSAQNKTVLACIAGFVLAVAVLGTVSFELPSQTAQIAYSPSAVPQPQRAPIAARLPENKSLANAPAEQAGMAAPEPPRAALQAPEAQQAVIDMPKDSSVASIYAPTPLGVTEIVLPFLIAGVIAVSASFLVRRKVEPEDKE
ncbi:MAG: hypothetical protein FJ358_07620 [Thaumarchaeota archaeon]|nr:hypothetical protein [Nitrososphaerota archaeon]